jgi:hypothetical protein
MCFGTRQFLMKNLYWIEPGQLAFRFNLPVFNEKILNKTSSQMKAYWSKLVFTGKGTPPKELLSDKEVIDLVSKNPNMIGYIQKESVTAAVKVVATF